VSGVGAVWAQDAHGVLGADGDMLWRVPADFRHFKATTLGGVVIMGRTTWESIGAALPGRASIVLTREPGWTAPDAVVAGGLDQAVERAEDLLAGLGPDPREEAVRALPRLWVIGGGSVYAQVLAAGCVDELVISVLDLDAAERARQRGLAPTQLVHAPQIDPASWHLTKAREPGSVSDPPGTWRPVSGDARWRVDHWRRRS